MQAPASTLSETRLAAAQRRYHTALNTPPYRAEDALAELVAATREAQTPAERSRDVAHLAELARATAAKCEAEADDFDARADRCAVANPEQAANLRRLADACRRSADHYRLEAFGLVEGVSAPTLIAAE